MIIVSSDATLSKLLAYKARAHLMATVLIKMREEFTIDHPRLEIIKQKVKLEPPSERGFGTLLDKLER